MSVDIASLVFEIDSTQAVTAEDRLEKLIVVSDRLDASARKVQTATQQAGIGIKSGADATTNAVKSATELAVAQGAVEKATRGATAASADTRAARALEAAAMRELVTATKQYARDQAAAAKAVADAQAAADRDAETSAQQVLALRLRLSKQRAAEEIADAQAAADAQMAADRQVEQSAQQALAFQMRMNKQRASEEEKAASTSASLARQVANLNAALDPLAAVELTAATRTKLLNDALAAGAITAEHHASMTEKVTEAAAAGAAGITKYAGATKLTSFQLQNLSFQLNDVVTGLASGQRPLQILAQQGGQVFQALQMGAGGVSGSIKGLLGLLTPLRLTFGLVTTAILATAAAMVSYENEIGHLSELTAGVGRQAGLTAVELTKLADASSAGSGASISQAENLESALLQTGKVGGGVFGDLIEIQKKYAIATGETLPAAQKELAASFADPVRGAQTLADKLSGLDGQTQQTIQSLVAQGRAFDAQKVLAAAYKDALADVGTTSNTLGGQFSTLANAVGNVATRFSEAVDQARLFIALGPKAIAAMQQQQAAQAAANQGKAAANNASLAGSALYLRLSPDAQAQKQLQDDVSTASRGLAASSQLGSFDGIVQNAQALERATRAQQSYVSATDKAHQLSLLDAQANEVNAQAQTKATRAVLGDIAAQRTRLQLAGQPLTQSEVDQRVADAKVTATAHQDRAPPSQDQQAIAAAVKDELTARQALTKNIQAVTDLRIQEINEELKGKEAQVATNKAISGGARAAIDQAEQNAASAKREAAYRDDLVAAIGEQISQQGVVNGYADRASSAQAALATSAAQENDIAATRLARQQDFERQEEAFQDGQLLLFGQITATEFRQRQAGLAAAQVAEKAVSEREAQVRIIQEDAANQSAALELDIARSQASASLLTSGYARAVAEKHILDLTQQEELIHAQAVVNATAINSSERERAEEALEGLKARQAADRQLAERQTDLIHAIQDASDAAGDLGDALGRHDWARLFDDLQRTIQTIQASFAANGLSGGVATAAGAAGSLIGGKAGNALGTAAGVFGGITSTFSAASLGMFGSLSGSILGLTAAIAPFAAPLAIIAGLASLVNLSGKPTNAGAGIALTPTALGATSGNKATADTTAAATQTGTAILQGEEALRQAGATLATTVQGLVIGTRDLSQIYLTNGQTITSAVGDASAAAEAGLKAVLQGATFTSAAEKTMVDSMLAAGQGFDAISTAIQNYAAASAAAQAISDNLADQILQLQDPEAFDLKGVHAAIDAQTAAAQAAVTAGYETADWLVGINAQLSTLEGLQLDQVMKKYADSVDAATAANAADAQHSDLATRLATDLGNQAYLTTTERAKELAGALDDTSRSMLFQIYATEDANSAAATKAQALSDAKDALSAAYDRESQAVQATMDKMQGFVTSLETLRQTILTGDLAANDPGTQYARTAAQFRSTATAAAGSDATALGALPDSINAFLTASLANSTDRLAYQRDVAEALRATDAAHDAALTQVNIASAQLDALNASVAGILAVNASVLSVKDALANYNNILAGGSSATGSANDNGQKAFDWSKATYDPVLMAYTANGNTPDGLHFATGGSFDVAGPSSGDKVPVNFQANGGEHVNISREDSMGAMAAELSALRQEMAAMRADIASTAKNTGKLADKARLDTQGGVWVRGPDSPDAPVKTAA